MGYQYKRCNLCHKLRLWRRFNICNICFDCIELENSKNMSQPKIIEDLRKDSILAIKDAISSFPKQFGLKAFPNQTFRMNYRFSFIRHGKIYLYTECQKEGWWALHTIGTVEEFKQQIIYFKESG